MLTFFEYLRQRAYESVLAGAQEALQSLERDGAFNKPAQTPKYFSSGDEPASLNHEPIDAAEHAIARAGVDDGTHAVKSSRAEKPAPRLRTRPKRKGARGK